MIPWWWLIVAFAIGGAFIFLMTFERLCEHCFAEENLLRKKITQLVYENAELKGNATKPTRRPK